MYSRSDSFPENSNSSEKKNNKIIVIHDKRATDGAESCIHVGLDGNRWSIWLQNQIEGENLVRLGLKSRFGLWIV